MESDQYGKSKFQQVVNKLKNKMFDILVKLLEKKKIGRLKVNE
jgi:hypothetical protein